MRKLDSFMKEAQRHSGGVAGSMWSDFLQPWIWPRVQFRWLVKLLKILHSRTGSRFLLGLLSLPLHMAFILMTWAYHSSRYMLGFSLFDRAYTPMLTSSNLFDFPNQERENWESTKWSLQTTIFSSGDMVDTRVLGVSLRSMRSKWCWPMLSSRMTLDSEMVKSTLHRCGIINLCFRILQKRSWSGLGRVFR